MPKDGTSAPPLRYPLLPTDEGTRTWGKGRRVAEKRDSALPGF